MIAYWFRLIGRLKSLTPSCKPQRRKRVTLTQVEGFWDQLARLRFAVEQPLNVSLAKDVLRLSEKHSLTVYDGAYLELAMRNRIPLATLDTQLEGAAKKEQVTLL